MNRLVLEGILKKNSKGRAYLVYFDWNGTRRILRLMGDLNEIANGRTVTLIGRPNGIRFEVEKTIVRQFPRRMPIRNSGVA